MFIGAYGFIEMAPRQFLMTLLIENVFIKQNKVTLLDAAAQKTVLFCSNELYYEFMRQVSFCFCCFLNDDTKVFLYVKNCLLVERNHFDSHWTPLRLDSGAKKNRGRENE